MSNYLDRYEEFRVNNKIKQIPGIRIAVGRTDKTIIYKKDKDRFDKLSQKFYGNPYHGWLILIANPEHGGLEFDIPNNTAIRIPFPFDSAINRYISEIKKYERLNE